MSSPDVTLRDRTVSPRQRFEREWAAYLQRVATRPKIDRIVVTAWMESETSRRFIGSLSILTHSGSHLDLPARVAPNAGTHAQAVVALLPWALDFGAPTLEGIVVYIADGPAWQLLTGVEEARRHLATLLASVRAAEQLCECPFSYRYGDLETASDDRAAGRR